MKHKIFTVFDTKSAAFLQPFFMPTDASAVRAISDLVNDPGHNFNKHPSDYTLFAIGEFSDSDASFTIFDAPTPLGKFITFLTPPPQVPLFPDLKEATNNE